MKLFVILSILIVSSHSRPAGDQIFFREDDDEIDNLLPGPNTTVRFIALPQATTNLEYGKFFQGDMKLSSEQERFYTTNYTSDYDDEEEEGGLFTRTGVLNTKYRWPKDSSGKVNVPYVIDPAASYSSMEKTMIDLAIDYLEYYTCIKFVQRTNQADYLHIISDKGCYSHVGKQGGKQDISFQKGGCFSRGTLMHEFIHALGYDHMQNHADRDKFVKILWENLRSEERYNFDRVDPRKYSNFNTEYDYLSVMHYSPKAFSKNGKETIIPKDLRYKDRIGQRKGLSTGDVERVNNMYGCKK